VRKVVIVGGGPAGLCAAAVLGRAGIAVEIVEISPDLHAQGVGLAVIGPSLRALAMVGQDLLDRCIEAGAAHHTMSFGGTSGQITRRVELARPAGPQYPGGFGIRRPVFGGLLAATAQRAGARLRLAATITAIRQEPDGVEAVLGDGSVIAGDLLVGADGLWSTVRELAFGQAPAPSFTGQVAWRAMVPRAPEIDAGIVGYNNWRWGLGSPSKTRSCSGTSSPPAPRPAAWTARWRGSCSAGTSGAGWWWRTRYSWGSGTSTPVTRTPTRPNCPTPPSPPWPPRSDRRPPAGAAAPGAAPVSGRRTRRCPRR
jgi:2-polyprenyl-6-methoxyphenol hydroxylase-like FAD-dependent oxidoreductase